MSNSPVWSREELAEQAAAALADVYVRTFVPTLPSWYERAHGGPIDFDNLKRCGPTFYAMSPYEVPSSDTPDGLVNAAASRWLFSYCDGNVRAVSIAVAATATHLRIVKGKLDPTSRRGGEFDAEGIPRGSTAPMSPEQAVEWLAVESGRRVSEVPRLILPGLGYYAQTGRWLLELESPIESRALASEKRQERTFFVGRSLRTFEREISRAEKRPRVADTLRGAEGQMYVFVRRVGHKARWERATIGAR